MVAINHRKYIPLEGFYGSFQCVRIATICQKKEKWVKPKNSKTIIDYGPEIALL